MKEARWIIDGVRYDEWTCGRGIRGVPDKSGYEGLMATSLRIQVCDVNAKVWRSA